MATLSFDRSHDLTFHVKCSILDDNASATLWTTPSTIDSSKWGVTVTRSGPSLTVKVDWYRADTNTVRHAPEITEGNGYTYKCMHIISHSHCEEIATTTGLPLRGGTESITGSISASKVRSDDKYQFDIVISTSKDLSYRATLKSLVSTISAEREILRSFLKDIHSVDVCFVFTSDQSYSNVGLWAHRAILSRIKAFEGLILKATKVLETTNESQTTNAASLEREQGKADGSGQPTGTKEEKTSGEPPILIIPIDKFSLATMCSIMYFIYSGEVQLSINPSQFAISKAESTLVLYNSQGKTREPIRWDPLGTESAWKLKDVTWQELGLAAEFYGVDGLRTLCEKEIVGVMNENNAIDILFNVGCHVEKVKKQAVDFIAEHMGSLFVGDSDPFEPFSDHPACHKMLIEVIRAKAARKA